MAIGAIVRNTAGGIAAFAAIFFVIPPLMNILPTSWNNAISPYLPDAAGRDVFSLTHGVHDLAPGPRLRAVLRVHGGRDRDRGRAARPSRHVAGQPSEYRGGRDDLELAAPPPAARRRRTRRGAARVHGRGCGAPRRAHDRRHRRSGRSRRCRSLWRRRRPLAVVVVVTAVALAIVALDLRLLPFQLAVALYTLAASSGTRTRAPGRDRLDRRDDRRARRHGLRAVRRLGRARRLPRRGLAARRQHRLAARVRARDRGEGASGSSASARPRRSASSAEEQSRIARELHDVVAHALSVIVVQAAAADDVFEVEPRRAREPIRAIELAARAALGDLRRVLGIIQDGAEYEPQPGLARLDSLVEQVRATGLDVALEIEGAARPLPAAVDLSAYRIVQEALTNTLKHAGAEHATRVASGTATSSRWRSGTTAAAAPNANGGSGLIGMRERVAHARRPAWTPAPRPDGGYLVSAQTPDRLIRCDRSASSSPTTRPSSAAASGSSSRRAPTSRSSARPRTARRRSGCARARARRDPHGRAHAGRGRDRGDAPRSSPSGSAARILVLTTFDLDEYVYARGARRRERLPAEGRPAGRPRRRDPARGQRQRAARARRHPAAARALRGRGARPATPAAAVAALTEREREILRLLAGGLSNAELAAAARRSARRR